MTKIHKVRVHSSNLSAVGYDEEKNELEIIFVNGSMYKYYGVPENVYKELMEAKSHGKYFHAEIRYRYEYVKTG